MLALVPIPAKRASFTSLPRELRDIVYKELFQERQQIDIQASTDGRFAARVRLGRVDQNGYSLTLGGLYVGDLTQALGLLRVNKQIHEEAAFAMYSSNSFRFKGTRVIKSFLRGIGDNRKHLEHIIAPDVDTSSQQARTLRKELKPSLAPRLRYLDVHWSQVAPFLTDEGKSYLRDASWVEGSNHNSKLMDVFHEHVSLWRKALCVAKPDGSFTAQIRTLPRARDLCKDCEVAQRHREAVDAKRSVCRLNLPKCVGHLKGCVRMDALMKESIKEACLQHEVVSMKRILWRESTP